MAIRIGSVEVPRVVLAPMAGYTNTSFRKICRSMGECLLVGEMVSSNALEFGSKETIDLLKMSEEERPIAQQIFGRDPKSMAIAAKIVYEKMNPDIIDINMGCPVPKIAISSKSGSALLKEPELAYEIVKAVVDAVPIPVTVKMRIGWDKNSINVVEFAKKMESAGASAITVHARTRSEFYSGEAHWEYIKQVKDAVSIPVFGNGDIRSVEDAIRMINETGCDGVAIGRACLGNPWIIRDIDEYFKYGKVVSNKPTYKERIDLMKYHFKLLKEDKNEKLALLQIRSNILFYLKGMPGSKEVKTLICKCRNEDDILSILDNYLLELENTTSENL